MRLERHMVLRKVSEPLGVSRGRMWRCKGLKTAAWKELEHCRDCQGEGSATWKQFRRKIYQRSPCRICCAVLSCPVLSDSLWAPWTVVHQAPLSVGFSRQGYWSGLPCPPPGDLPNRGIEPRSSALQADSLPLSCVGSPLSLWQFIQQQQEMNTKTLLEERLREYLIKEWCQVWVKREKWESAAMKLPTVVSSLGWYKNVLVIRKMMDSNKVS